MKVATSERKSDLAIVPVRKYNALYSLLLQKFEEARAKGYQADFNWNWSKARSCTEK